VIGTTLLLLVGTFLWSKMQPELIYAISQGYSSEELKIINGLSFKDLVVYWGFETASLLALLNIAKGLAFSMSIIYLETLVSWQHWLGLCCLLMLASNPDVPASLGFWKRWTVFLGAAGPLLFPLVQLSLAVFIALLLLTQRKKLFSLSSSIAGLLYTFSNTLPISDMLLMLAACFIASFGVQFIIQNIPLTKEASKPI
jgi:hypothetical protein